MVRVRLWSRSLAALEARGNGLKRMSLLEVALLEKRLRCGLRSRNRDDRRNDGAKKKDQCEKCTQQPVRNFHCALLASLPGPGHAEY